MRCGKSWRALMNSTAFADRMRPSNGSGERPPGGGEERDLAVGGLLDAQVFPGFELGARALTRGAEHHPRFGFHPAFLGPVLASIRSQQPVMNAGRAGVPAATAASNRVEKIISVSTVINGAILPDLSSTSDSCASHDQMMGLRVSRRFCHSLLAMPYWSTSAWVTRSDWARNSFWRARMTAANARSANRMLFSKLSSKLRRSRFALPMSPTAPSTSMVLA